MADVILKHVKKIYDGGFEAVPDFNLEIKDKEFIVFVGPSGCGKSTTLRMIAGLEEISRGEIYINDRLVNAVAPKDRDIAMVFQNYALYPHLNVYDNMAFSLKLRKISKAEIDKKVNEAASILGIQDLLTRKPKALSGGQRQRVAIGRAIVRNPQVFLMDEPLSNLDAKLRNQMRTELIKLRRKINTTFIYVTHDQTEAMTLGDRIVIMDKGIIQQVGTPQEVFMHPKNLFVAGFIGTPQMNFFDAFLEHTPDGYVIKIEGSDMDVSKAINDKLCEKSIKNQKIILGVRPEHAFLCDKDRKDSIKCKVDVSEMMGSEIYLHLKTENGTPCTVRVAITELTADKRSFKNGEEVYISFQKDLCHMFNVETKNNLL